MSPISKAEQAFSAAYPDASFVKQLALYLKHGFVYCSPDMFFMMRPVNSRAGLKQIATPEFQFNHCDCWYVDLCSGRLKDLICHVPYHLPKMCFARKFKEKLKFYETRKFMERCLV